MTRLRPASRTTRPSAPRPEAGDWRSVRAHIRLAALFLFWLRCLPASRFRRRWTARLTRHLGQLEHMVRCLLLILRVRPAPVRPFSPLAEQSPAARGPAPTGLHRFSLCLRQFAWAKPQGQPLPAARRPATCDPEARRAALRPADPVGQLTARLAALQAVMQAPHPHAGKLAAALMARGFRRRLARPCFPAPELWLIPDAALPRPIVIGMLPAPDTS